MTRSDKMLIGMATTTVLLAVSVVSVILLVPPQVDDVEHASSALSSAPLGEARRPSTPAARTVQPSAAAAVLSDDVIEAEFTRTSMRGRVTDTSKTPVEGAEVSCELYFPDGMPNYGLVDEHVVTSATDERGMFAVDVPGTGRYRVTVSHPLCSPWVREGVVSGKHLEIVLEPAGVLVGTVVSVGTDNRIADAEIAVRKVDVRWRKAGQADASGRFELTGLFTGVLLVSLTANGFIPVVDQPVEIATPGRHGQRFEMVPGRRVFGTVVDATALPMPGVDVTVGPFRARTDAAGNYDVAGLAPDWQSLTFIADGYLAERRQVNMGGSRLETRVDLALSTGGSITGRVLDELGKPLVGVKLRVPFNLWGNDNAEDPFQARLALSDAEGRFTLTALPWLDGGGQYLVHAKLPGFAAGRVKAGVVRTDSPSPFVQIVLTKGGDISGRVLDPSGVGLAHVKVTCELQLRGGSRDAETGDLSFAVLTDGSGAYTFASLYDGSWSLTVLAEGFANQRRSGLVITKGAPVSGIDITLVRAEVVRGIVTDEQEIPVAGARVSLRNEASWGDARTDDKGEYVINTVVGAPYRGHCVAEGFISERRDPALPSAGRLDFRLRRQGYVHGQVLDRDSGLPIARFAIELTRPDGAQNEPQKIVRSNFADPMGRFKLAAPTGTWLISASAKGYVASPTETTSVGPDIEPEKWTIGLSPAGSFEAWVFGARDVPVGDCRVFWRRFGQVDPEQWIRGASTESDGFVFMHSLVDGVYEFAFVAEGRLPLRIESGVAIRPGDLTSLRVRLYETGPVEVLLTDVDGNPQGRMQYSVARVDGSPIGVTRINSNGRGPTKEIMTGRRDNVRADRRGQSLFRDLPAGAYMLLVPQSREWAAQDLPFVVNSTQSTSLNVILNRRGGDRRSSPGR